ncbi:hypothetical protein ABT144_24650 [Streptomyces sp. NPDC002039]|uniref:hypothetical protein n=1 Tax=Streptomyces sp. NPDC002039 TaxID=3154660 RepID=UPI0033201F26
MTDAATRWHARTRLALAARSVDSTTADAVLAEVEQHCVDSGESPEEAFGPPEEYAAAVLGERIAPEERLRHARNDLTPAQALCRACAPVGLASLTVGAGLWITNGLMSAVTPGALAGSSLVAMALAGGGIVSTIRNRPRRALGWGAVATTTVIGAVLFTSLSDRPLGHLPSPLLCVLGLVLLWTAIWAEPTENSEGAPMKPRTDGLNTGGLNTGDLNAGDLNTDDLNADERRAWLGRLPQLLTERHAISRARAAELTKEAADHLDAGGRAPEEEFGPVELYALRLSEAESPRARWWKRDAVLEAALAVILAGYLVVAMVSGGPVWQIALAAGALAVDLAILGTRLARKRPDASAGR